MGQRVASQPVDPPPRIQPSGIVVRPSLKMKPPLSSSKVRIFALFALLSTARTLY